MGDMRGTKRTAPEWVRSTALITLFIGICTAAAYWQVSDHSFINFDDNIYVTANSHVQQGITAQGVSWALRMGEGPYWHPLTWLSHMLDVELFGLDAGMHHLMNLLFHVLNVILLFTALRMATGSPWRSAFVVALFALHPVNVDTVAWVAERKNLLSTSFWMLTTIAYVHYVRCPSIPRYCSVVLAFVLGLLAKPMLVTMPFVLLMLDYWPLERVLAVPGERSGFRIEGERIGRLMAEKVPLLVLSAASIVLSAMSMSDIGVSVTRELVPLGLRMKNALVSYPVYLGKLFWPADLTFFYPYPEVVSLWQVAGALLVVLGITLAATWSFRRAPWFIVGWLWFLGTLMPVLGLVQGGLWPAIAERWEYVPSIGIFMIAAWGVPHLVGRVRIPRTVLPAAVGMMIVACMVLTLQQVRVWKDDFTLFSHGVAVNPDNYVAQVNLGEVMARNGRYDDAIFRFREALRVYPADTLALTGLAQAYRELGETGKAQEYYLEALRYRPDDPKISSRIAMLYAETGQDDKAMDIYARMMEHDPSHAGAEYGLGVLYARKGDPVRAEEHLRRSLRLNPSDAEVHRSLGVVLMSQGRARDAERHFAEAARIDPESEEIQGYLAQARSQREKIEADIAALALKRRSEPGNGTVLQTLGMLYAGNGDDAAALEAFMALADLQPENPGVHYNIACLHARGNRTEEAVLWLQKALDKGFGDWTLLKNDRDLENIRNTTFYRELMERHGG